MGALKRAVTLAALAALAGVDAAECRGPSTCGCSNNQFCNFDYGSSGGCESCSSFSSAAACGQDGLPSDGEDDCVACCFGSESEFTGNYVVAPEGTGVQTPAVFPGMRCYSRLNAIEGCEKSPGDCWEACRNQYGDRIVAIDWNEDDGKCHCQDACDCLVSTTAPTNCQSGYDGDGYTRRLCIGDSGCNEWDGYCIEGVCDETGGDVYWYGYVSGVCVAEDAAHNWIVHEESVHLDGECTCDAACDQTLVLSLTTDEYPHETSWTLATAPGANPACPDASASGSFSDASTFHRHTVSTNLCAGETYMFEVRDSYGDGIFSYDTAYKLTLEGALIFESNGDFTYEESHAFLRGLWRRPSSYRGRTVGVLRGVRTPRTCQLAAAVFLLLCCEQMRGQG